jgi:hypothetical protein
MFGDRLGFVWCFGLAAAIGLAAAAALPRLAKA